MRGTITECHLYHHIVGFWALELLLPASRSPRNVWASAPRHPPPKQPSWSLIGTTTRQYGYSWRGWNSASSSMTHCTQHAPFSHIVLGTMVLAFRVGEVWQGSGFVLAFRLVREQELIEEKDTAMNAALARRGELKEELHQLQVGLPRRCGPRR